VASYAASNGTDVSKELVFGVITSDLVCFALRLVSFLELSQSVCPVDGKLCVADICLHRLCFTPHCGWIQLERWGGGDTET
jgi:hypothetical protein